MRQIIVDHAANNAVQGMGIRRAVPTFQMNDDVVAGFKTAVGNNQTTLALEYLRYIIDGLLAEDTPVAAVNSDLEKRVEELEKLVASLTAPAKRTAAKKEEPGNE